MLKEKVHPRRVLPVKHEVQERLDLHSRACPMASHMPLRLERIKKVTTAVAVAVEEAVAVARAAAVAATKVAALTRVEAGIAV
jgi:hypothetical protein